MRLHALCCFLAVATTASARTTTLFHRLQADGVNTAPLTLDYERAVIESSTNDNTTFVLTLEGSVLPRHAMLVLRLGDIGYPLSGWSRDARGLGSFSFRLDDAAIVSIVGDRLEAEIFRREHPGHTLLAWFIPDKDAFFPGEAVTATLHIRNTGRVAIRFRDGGHQRGPRNNQFRFTATYAGSELPVIGPVLDTGGLATHVDLRPGDEFTKQATVTDWITFSERGHYSVRGWFEFDLLAGGERVRCIWADSVSAGFEIAVR